MIELIEQAAAQVLASDADIDTKREGVANLGSCTRLSYRAPFKGELTRSVGRGPGNGSIEGFLG